MLAERANAHRCPERTHEPLSISRQDEARWKRPRYGWKGTEKAEGQRGHGMSASPPAASLHGDMASCWDVHRKTRRGKKQRGGSRRRTLHLPLPLVSLKQPRPRLLALLRSQQRCWLHFPQPAPLFFAAVFIAQLLLQKAWIGAGGRPSNARHRAMHHLGATATLWYHTTPN